LRSLWSRALLTEFEGQPRRAGPEDTFVDEDPDDPEGERDRDLGDKLAAEAQGVLAWVVRGARAFLTYGFDPPATVTAATDRYRQSEDTVGRFIADCLILGDAEWCTSSQMAEELDRWAKDTGVDLPRMNDVAERLYAAGCTSRRQRMGGQRRETKWTGVGFGGAAR